MIVSHRRRFIFVAVPKTGTHAVRRALREHMGEKDLEQVGLFVNRRFPWPELAGVSHGHLSLRQVRPHVGEEAFADYFKFAFVRNPYDRFVSYCAFMLRHNNAFHEQPRAVMRHLLFEAPPEQHVLFQPQSSLLLDDDGATLLTDALGRVEDMQASFNLICARLNIAPRPLERVNSSARGDYHRYYDAALVRGVADRYAQDLELFGYDFEGTR